MAATKTVTIKLSEEELTLLNAARGGYPLSTWCRVELVKKANWLLKRANRASDSTGYYQQSRPANNQDGTWYDTSDAQ